MDDKSLEKTSHCRRSQPRYNLLFDPDSDEAGQQKAGNYLDVSCQCEHVRMVLVLVVWSEV